MVDMKWLPKFLIYTRLVAGFSLVVISLLRTTDYKTIAIMLVTYGILSDILDGIFARRLKVSGQGLRRLDSTVDQIFWISVAFATYLKCKSFFADHSQAIILLMSAEALTYLVSFVKFRKEVATHAIMSKIWALSIFATLVQVILTCRSSILFGICFYLGLVSRLEILAILILLRTWTNDVPTVYHAMLLRKGRSIKRNDFLNG